MRRSRRRWVMILIAAMLLAAMIVPYGATAHAEMRYQNGFPSDGRFFPLGVWLQSPRNAAEYEGIGVNTFVGVSGGVNDAGLEELAKHHMFAAAEQDDAALKAHDSHVIKAWLQPDEPDDAQPRLLGFYGPCIAAGEVARRTRAITVRDATRPVMVNFGPGVADEVWNGRGSCTGDLKYYNVAMQGTGIVSFDIYPVASDVPRVTGQLQYVARGIERLVHRAREGQAVWSIVETTALNPQRPVRPEELRAEVWMALVHGASGIVYFVHEWVPHFREDAIFRHPDIVSEASRINAQVASLAPVLNSPTLVGKVTVTAPASIAVMAKSDDRALYVFSVAMSNEPTSAQFTIHGLGDAEASVLGEQRRLAVRGGVLEDGFVGYGVHLYRIANGEKVD